MVFLVARVFEDCPPADLPWCRVPRYAQIFIAAFCSRVAKAVEVGEENEKREGLERTALDYVSMTERLK